MRLEAEPSHEQPRDLADLVNGLSLVASIVQVERNIFTGSI